MANFAIPYLTKMLKTQMKYKLKNPNKMKTKNPKTQNATNRIANLQYTLIWTISTAIAFLIIAIYFIFQTATKTQALNNAQDYIQTLENYTLQTNPNAILDILSETDEYQNYYFPDQN